MEHFLFKKINQQTNFHSFTNFTNASQNNEELEKNYTISTPKSKNRVLEKTEQEIRINDFLDQKGVKFKSPWDKMYDYIDEKRRKNTESNEDTSNSFNNLDSNKEKGSFVLGSKLFCQRMDAKNQKIKCFSQSPQKKK